MPEKEQKLKPTMTLTTTKRTTSGNEKKREFRAVT